MASNYNAKRIAVQKGDRRALHREQRVCGSKSIQTQDYQFLLSNKFQYVVNCTIDVPNYFEYNGVHYLHFKSNEDKRKPLFDGGKKRVEKMAEFVAVAEEVGLCCLVHCNSGNNRSVAFVAGYLMHRFSWSFDKAFDFLRAKDVKIALTNCYLQQARSLETLLRDNGPLSVDWNSPCLSEEELVAYKTYLNSLKPLPCPTGARLRTSHLRRIAWKDRVDKQDKSRSKQEEPESRRASKSNFASDPALPTRVSEEEIQKNTNQAKNSVSQRAIRFANNKINRKPEERKRLHSPNMIRKEQAKDELKNVRSLKEFQNQSKNVGPLVEKKQPPVFVVKQQQRDREAVRQGSVKKRREIQPQQASFEQQQVRGIIQSQNVTPTTARESLKRQSDSATDFQFQHASRPPLAYISKMESIPRSPRQPEFYRSSPRQENYNDREERKRTDSFMRRENLIDNYLWKDNNSFQRSLEPQQKNTNYSRERGENRNNTSREKRQINGYKIPVAISNYLQPSLNSMLPPTPIHKRDVQYEVRKESRERYYGEPQTSKVFMVVKERPTSKSGKNYERN